MSDEAEVIREVRRWEQDQAKARAARRESMIMGLVWITIVVVVLGAIIGLAVISKREDAALKREHLKRERAFVTCVEALDFETCSTLRGTQ